MLLIFCIRFTFAFLERWEKWDSCSQCMRRIGIAKNVVKKIMLQGICDKLSITII